MRKVHSCSIIVLLIILVVAGGVFARDTVKPEPQIRVDLPAASRLDAGPGAMQSNRAAAQGTTWLAYYNFDSGPNCVTEGWTSLDLTAQTHVFTHVDDFAGLGGGISGGLVPLEGTQSMWCGARPDAADIVLCGYSRLPGYGNGWAQALCTAGCLAVSDSVAINFAIRWDSEPDYDATWLQVDECDDQWSDIYGGIGTWDGNGSDTLSVAVADTVHSGTLRFRFYFESDGAWSDQDGLWNSDGAYILDQLSVTDRNGVVVAYEDFEDESVGDTDADDWVGCNPPGYGDYAALYPGLTVVQGDPCKVNLTCLWAFYNGSTADYSCGGWPAQPAVPYEDAGGRVINNEIWSPNIAVAGSGSVWNFRFDVYRDLPLGPLVFYTWHVRSIVDGCPDNWGDFSFVYYGGGKDWLRATFSIGSLLTPGASHVDMSLGVIDMCPFWGGIYGDCLCHSHAPLFDNVELYRVASGGPQWQVRDIDLFQDTFSADGTLTGTARADEANDILPGSSAGILPGDSVVVTVRDPDNDMGLDGGSAAVYCYVSVDGPNSGTAGEALIDDMRYRFIGDVSAGGRTWAHIQMDTCFTFSGSPIEDRYCIDLNDNLFVPGDTVWFFFGASNVASDETYFAFPVPTPSGQTGDIELAAQNPDEFTILPAAAYTEDGDVLYVDGMNFRGAQWAFDTTFDVFDGGRWVDRYDIRGPSSAVGNHPGSRVGDVFQQLLPVYEVIIWNTGNLTTAFGDGSGSPDKSNDTGMLQTFLDNLTYPGGVYLNGDDVADVWLNEFTSSSAITLRSVFMNFDVTTGDQNPIVGTSPLGVGIAGPHHIFHNAFGPDTLVVFGGCPLINDFDVLQPVGPSSTEMTYQGAGNSAPAILTQTPMNSQGTYVGFVLSGFSFHNIRNHADSWGELDRNVHMDRIMTYLNQLWNRGSDAGPVAHRNGLSQNYPNPFNPVTTIDYQVATAGRVTLRVYNVAGQLVRSLVDGQVAAGVVHTARWRGLTDAGAQVSSGVYFYKLVAEGFVETRKMVLLK